MRVLVDLGSHVGGAPAITQVERVPDAGVGVPINGKYVLPIFPGAEFPITADSYVLDGGGDVDGEDVSSISFAHLLAAYPQFGNVYFNPLLTAANVGELDPTLAFHDPILGVDVTPRYQSGRGPGLNDGQMPTHTALLGQNFLTTPVRPGLMISDNIDISPYAAAGADEFMVYWKILEFSVTEDICADFGVLAGQNTPAIRTVEETDQEPTGLSVYISPDNGMHWCHVGLLEPVAFCAKTTAFRVAFRSSSLDKIYLAHFSVLF